MGILAVLKFAFFNLIPEQLFAKLPQTRADIKGRTFLVTGSNTGLGLALAIHLARLEPAHLILAVRDLKKGDAAKKTIIAETGFTGLLEVWELDMADFGSVKRFAERANTSLKRLDGAVLNAGINTVKWNTSEDGWERILQVNGLATGLLGVLLLPLLQATSKLPPPHPDATQTPPHLTITGSSVMFTSQFPERSAQNILQALNDEKTSSLDDRYAVTKLFNLFLAREFAKLPAAEGVVVNVVNPGLCMSEFARDFEIPAAAMFVISRLAWTTEQGARNLLYALLTPTAPGAYISACKVQRWVLFTFPN
ncbi:NAD(P)-binding protein [Mycena crocata]|nr:NAD(P)-binding protein [Mycena crocata]